MCAIELKYGRQLCKYTMLVSCTEQAKARIYTKETGTLGITVHAAVEWLL